jgi:hypothetical protein
VTPEMRKNGWYPIQGGPYDGQEYYAPNEPKAFKPVFLGSMTATQYEWSKDCTAVVYSVNTHTRTPR